MGKPRKYMRDGGDENGHKDRVPYSKEEEDQHENEEQVQDENEEQDVPDPHWSVPSSDLSL